MKKLLIALTIAAQLHAETPLAPRTDTPGIEIASVEREWHGQDYADFKEGVASKKVPLPRIHDPRTAALFARITNADNLSFHRDKSVPVGPRLHDLNLLLQSWNAILMIYGSDPAGPTALHEEMAQGQAFSLRVMAVMTELIDQLLPTIPKDDKYETRMNGLRMVNSGLVTSVDGMLQSLTEPIYTADDRSCMLRALADTLPRFKPKLPDSFRAEAARRIRKMKSQLKARDADALSAILKTLEA